MGKRELVVLFNLSFWCLVMVEWLYLAVPWGRLRFVIWYFLIILTDYFSYLNGVLDWIAYVSIYALVFNNTNNKNQIREMELSEKCSLFISHLVIRGIRI